MVTIPTLTDTGLNQVNYPSLRYLRQQTPNGISHSRRVLLQRRAYHPWVNRTRLSKLNEVVKVRLFPSNLFSDGLPDIGTGASEDGAVTHTNRDLSKISMFGCDGPECYGDPVDAQ